MARYLQLEQSTNPNSRQVRLVGHYVYIKNYNVVDDSGRVDETFNGWVVQLVQKQSHVTGLDGQVLNTTEDFLRYTSRKATYMTYSYIERFPVRNGRSVDGDIFSSGGVARYENKQLRPVTGQIDPGDESYATTGTVNQVGTNLLFSDADTEFLNGFRWTRDEKRPAHGLDETAVDHWSAIVERGNKAANKPVHSLEATWAYLPNDTQLTIHFIDNGPGGGPGDYVAPAARLAYCRALEQVALRPGLTLHSVTQGRDGGFYANMCSKFACYALLVVGVAASAAGVIFGRRGGHGRRLRKTRRLRK